MEESNISTEQNITITSGEPDKETSITAPRSFVEHSPIYNRDFTDLKKWGVAFRKLKETNDAKLQDENFLRGGIHNAMAAIDKSLDHLDYEHAMLLFFGKEVSTQEALKYFEDIYKFTENTDQDSIRDFLNLPEEKQNEIVKKRAQEFYPVKPKKDAITGMGGFGQAKVGNVENPDFNLEEAREKYAQELAEKNLYGAYVYCRENFDGNTVADAMEFIRADNWRSDVANIYLEKLTNMEPEKIRDFISAVSILTPQENGGFFYRIFSRLGERATDTWDAVKQFAFPDKGGMSPDAVYANFKDAFDENGNPSTGFKALRDKAGEYSDGKGYATFESRSGSFGGGEIKYHNMYSDSDLKKMYEEGKRRFEDRKLFRQLRALKSANFDYSEISSGEKLFEDVFITGIDMLKYLAAGAVAGSATGNPYAGVAASASLMFAEEASTMYDSLVFDGNMPLDKAAVYSSLYGVAVSALEQFQITRFSKTLKGTSYLLKGNPLEKTFRGYLKHDLKELPKTYLREGGAETFTEFAQNIADFATKKWVADHENATFDERELWENFANDFVETAKIMPTLMAFTSLIGYGVNANRRRVESGASIKGFFSFSDAVNNHLRTQSAIAQLDKAYNESKAKTQSLGDKYGEDFVGEYSKSDEARRAELLAGRFKDDAGKAQFVKEYGELEESMKNGARLSEAANRQIATMVMETQRRNSEETKELSKKYQKIEEEEAGSDNDHLSLVRSFLDKFGGSDDVVFVENSDDLPMPIRSSAGEILANMNKKGFYNGADGKIYLLKSHFKTAADAFMTLAHERTHWLAAKLRNDPSYDGMLSRVLSLMGGEQGLKAFLPESYSGLKAADAAEEYLARVCERVALEQVLNEHDRGIWSTFKNWLSRIFGENTFIDIADREIAGIARKLFKRANDISSKQNSDKWEASTPEENGATVAGSYIVVDASGLITSTDEGYDDTLQPRNRARRGSVEQVAKIAANLDPKRLDFSTTTDDGAPIVDERGQVLSGNGRTLAIRQAYANNPDKALQYRDYVLGRARQMGISVAPGIKNPVLVRRVENLGNLSMQEFAARSNKSKVAAMSNAEQAVADARVITELNNNGGRILDLFFPSDNGDVLAASNTDFINAFLDAVGGREQYIDANGRIKPNLAPRISAAVLAAMLDPEKRAVVENLLDNPDGWSSLIRGLIGCAANLGKLIGNPDYDISKELSEAAELFINLRREGLTFAQYKAQGQLFDAPLSDEAGFLMELFEANSKTPTGISGVLNEYYKLAKNIDTTTEDMFGAQNPTKIEELQKAFERYSALAPEKGEAVKWRETGNAWDEIFGDEEFKRQYDEVVAKYKNTPMWLKAPNGADTKLTERQWVTVRTPNFKKWFGDWEKQAYANAAMDFLENTAPVKELSGKEFQKDGVKLTDKVPAFFKSINNVAHNENLGDVVLDLKGVEDSISHGIGRLKSAAFMAVPEVIEKGFIFNRENNWKERGWDTAVIVAPVKIAAEDYVCEVVVKKVRGQQRFYLHEVEIKKTLDGVFKSVANNGNASQVSKLILGKHLAEVKGNVSKVVDENGEPLVVYHGTRATSRFNVFKGSEHFFSDNREVADGFLNGNDFVLEINGDKYPVSRRDLEILADMVYADASEFENLLGDWEAGDLSSEGVREIISDITHNEYTVEALEDFPLSIKEGGRIIEVFLNIRNPVEVDYGGETWQAGKVMPEQDLSEHPDADGLIGRNIREGGLLGETRKGEDFPISTDYVVRDSTQIKSVDNVGTFSADNPDIRWRESDTRSAAEREELTRKHRELYERYKNGDNSAYAEAVRLVAEEAERKGYATKVYHGTGADGFNVADASSRYEENGEGAQAHGAGLYLAVSKETAEGYWQRAKMQEIRTIGGRTFEDLGLTRENFNNYPVVGLFTYLHSYGVEESKRKISERIENQKKRLKSAEEHLQKAKGEFEIELARQTIDSAKKEVSNDNETLEAIDKILSILKENGLSLSDYEYRFNQGKIFDWFANLNEDNTLDADKPLKKQGEGVRKAIFEYYKSRPDDYIAPKDIDDLDAYNDGERFYKDVIFQMRREGAKNPRLEASKLLAKLGIKGYTYDGRQDGRCYVSFEGGATVKLQDPFTFNDNGELIPLTERFDSSNPDMRWKIDAVLMPIDINILVARNIDELMSALRKSHKLVLSKKAELEAQYPIDDKDRKSKIENDLRIFIFKNFSTELLPVAGLSDKDFKFYKKQFGIRDRFVYTSLGYAIEHYFNRHPNTPIEDYFLLPDTIFNPDQKKEVGKWIKDKFGDWFYDTSQAFVKEYDKWHVSTIKVDTEITPSGKKLVAFKNFYNSKKEPYGNKKTVEDYWKDATSSSNSFRRQAKFSTLNNFNRHFSQSQNSSESQGENSTKELERQERGENPLVWASIVMAKDILQGRGVSQAKLEKLLPPSEGFSGSNYEYVKDRAKKIAEQCRAKYLNVKKDLDQAVQLAESDYYWQVEQVEKIYNQFRKDGEAYGEAKQKVLQWLAEQKEKKLRDVKGYEPEDFSADLKQSILNAMENEPERPKPEESESEELEGEEDDIPFGDDAADLPEAPSRSTLGTDIRGVIWEIRKEVITRSRKSDDSQAVMRQRYRNTLVNVLSDAAKALTFGREREAILAKIKELERVNYAVITIKDGDRAGQKVDNFTLRAEHIAMRIFNRGVWDTKRELTDKLWAALKRYGKKPSRMERDDKKKTPQRLYKRISDIKNFVFYDDKQIAETFQAATEKLEDAEKYFDKNADNPEDIEDIRADVANTIADLKMFGAWRDKSRGEMAQAIEFLENYISDEMARQQQKLEEKKAHNQELRDIIINALRVSTRNANKDGKLREALRKIITGSMPFDSFLNILAEYATGDVRARFDEYRDKLVSRIYRASDNVSNEIYNKQQALFQALEEIYGMDSGAALKRLMKADEKLAEFSNADKTVDVKNEMSIGNIIQLLAVAEQKQYLKNVYLHRIAAPNERFRAIEKRLNEIALEFPDSESKYTKEWEIAKTEIEQLNKEAEAIMQEAVDAYKERLIKVLIPEDLKLLDWLRTQYAADLPAISRIARRVLGLPIESEDPKYMPVKILRGKDVGDEGGAAKVPVVPKSLTPRVPHARDVDETVDPIQLFFERTSENSQFKNFSEIYIELRAVFGDETVQGLIESHCGADVLRGLCEFIADIASGKTKGFKYDEVRKASGIFAIMQLGWNLGSGVRQLFPGVFSWGTYIGTTNVLKNLATCWSADGRAAMREIKNTDTFKRRLAIGNMQIIEELLSAPDQSKFWRLYKRYALFFNKASDVLAVLFVGQGVYRAGLNAYLHKGFSFESAKEKAMSDMWFMAERTQASGKIMNMSSWQRRGGDLAKSIGMFSSPPQLMFSKSAEEIRRAIALGVKTPEGRAAVWKAAKTALTVSLLVEGSYAVTTVLWNALLRGGFDDDDKEFILKGMITGPFGGLFLFGRMVDAASSDYSSGIMPMEGLVRPIKNTYELFKDLAELNFDEVPDDAWKILSNIFSPARDARKIAKGKKKEKNPWD